MKSEITKENLIKQTICLIKETNGAIENITMRKIAERAGVGVGLANHYFKSKEHLIEVCVQTIISDIINSFHLELCESKEPIEITKCTAKQVMDFLMENKQISKVSILSDMIQPKAIDNTMKTVLGFRRCLSGEQMTDKNMINSFMITSVLQEAFLRKDILKETLGIDFYDKEQRDRFIDYTIERFGNFEVFNN